MMGRSFGLSEFLYLIRAIPWTLLLSLGALLGGGILRRRREAAQRALKKQKR
jgi:hypothetical protein